LDDYRQFCEFCGTLKKVGADLQICRLIPGKLLKVTEFAPDCLILETDAGPLALWIYHGQEATLASQNLLLKILETHGAKNFLYPLPLNDDRTYAPLDGRRWFYITPWPDTRRIFFRDPDDLKLLVDLLLDFRKLMDTSGAGYFMPFRLEKTNLLHKFAAIIDSLNSFALLAGYRLKPTRFDELFLKYYATAILQAQQALKQLAESEYQRLLANISLKERVISRLVRNNLRISPENRVICLRCSDCRPDLPVVDLGTLLVKTGRSRRWSYSGFHDLLSRYQRDYPLNRAEQKVLLAFLTCPWSFYRLTARYYYNRTAWSIGTYVERLERVLEDEPYRIDLLAILGKEFESGSSPELVRER
jgi:CotS family spore coat protein